MPFQRQKLINKVIYNIIRHLYFWQNKIYKYLKNYAIDFFQVFELDFQDSQDFELGQRHLENPLVLVQLLAQLVDVVQLCPEEIKVVIFVVKHCHCASFVVPKTLQVA